MKKTNLLMAAAMLVAANQAGAVISASTTAPGELFVVIYDSATGKTFYKDLGITSAEFMAPTASSCVDGYLATDPNYSGFLNSSSIIFNVAAINPRVVTGADVNNWGYMLTSREGDTIFPKTSAGIDRTLQNIQGYSVALNGDTIGPVSDNLSGVYEADAGYAGFTSGGFWGAQINGSLTGDTTGSVNVNPDFYYVSGLTRQVEHLGSWSLSAAGVLKFTGAGTTKVCNYIDTGNGAGGGTGTGTGGGTTGGTTKSPIDNTKADVRVAVPSTGKALKAVKITLQISKANGKKAVQVFYSKNGGASYRNIGTVPAKKTRLVWKPKKTDVSTSGYIKACVKGTTTCDITPISISK